MKTRAVSSIVAVALCAWAPVTWARPPRVTPETASAKRQEVLAGDPAADALEESARELGDPILFIQAARKRLDAAESPEQAEAAREPTLVALDILHFIEGGGANARWKLLEDGTASAHIDEAQTLLRDIDEAIERMRQEALAASQAASEVVEEPRRKREPKPGTGLIAAGSVLTAIGAGGLGLMGAGLAIGSSRQSEVEAADPNDQATIDRLDDEGAQANMMAYIGIGAGAVGLGVGIALIAIGVKKRKQGRADDQAVMVLPSLGGLVISGRF